MANRQSLPQNYQKAPAKLLEDFSNVSHWVSPLNVQATTDTTYVRTGISSVRMQTQGAANILCTIDKVVSIDMSAASRQFHARFYVNSNVLEIQKVFFYFTTGGSAWSKYIQSNVSGSGGSIRQGWNTVPLYPNSLGATLQDKFELVNRLRIGIQTTSGAIAPADIIFDSIWYDAQPLESPRIVLSFDDGWKTVYDNAFQGLNSRGVKATMYTVPNFISPTGQYCSEANIREMHDSKWCIANHTFNHAYYKLENYTVSDYVDQIRKAIVWLDGNGYSEGALHLAYPRGEYDQTLVDALKPLGLKTARGVTNGYWSTVDDELYKMHAKLIDTSISETLARAFVENIINCGGTGHLTFHQIPIDDTVNTPTSQPSLSWSQVKFFRLIDYCLERGVQFITIDEWFQGLTNPRYQNTRLLV